MVLFFLFAGEPSGDLHGSQLIRALKSLNTTHHFLGVGGPLMRNEGLSGPLKMEDFQVMGFSDVLKALPHLRRSFYQVLHFILKHKPEIVILIDYPGFNLRLAKALRKKGFKGKIVQYICPSVWAHGKKRICTMVNTLDLLLTIYPFEIDCFSHTSLNVKYIGNPLINNFNNWQYKANWLTDSGISDQEKILALFPGSRQSEINRHTPLQLQAALFFKNKFPQFKLALSYSSENFLPLIHSIIAKTPFKIGYDLFLIPPKYRYELMQDCTMALAKSGTVTLELALHKKPTLVIYELSSLNYFVAKYLLRLNLPYYCIVNIIGNKEIFPEIMGPHLSAEKISQSWQQLYVDEERKENIQHACKNLLQLLGSNQTHQMAAQAILELIK